MAGKAQLVQPVSKASRDPRAAPDPTVSTAGTDCKVREDLRALAAPPGKTALTESMLPMEAKAAVVLPVPAAPRGRLVLSGPPEPMVTMETTVLMASKDTRVCAGTLELLVPAVELEWVESLASKVARVTRAPLASTAPTATTVSRVPKDLPVRMAPTEHPEPLA